MEPLPDAVPGPVTLHLAHLAVGFGARLLAVTTRADSTLTR